MKTRFDEGLFPRAYGVLGDEHLMHPVDMSGWPVKIDESRQLFIDDYLIAETSRIRRQVHQPVPDRRNPVIVPDRPWEGDGVIAMWALHDAGRAVFRMWYGTQLKYTTPEGIRTRFPLLYAESQDGIVWEKPNLGLVEHEGSRDNNFVLHGGRMEGMFCRPDSSDPERRFLAMMRQEPEIVPTDGFYLYASADGIRWSRLREAPVFPSLEKTEKGFPFPVNGLGDTSLFRWDSQLDLYVGDVKFVLTPEPGRKMRCRGITTSADLIHWTRPRMTIYPDGLDEADSQVYANLSFTYQGTWIGLLRMMHEDRTGWKQVEVELSASRDGLSWYRVGDRQVFLPLGAPDAWDPDYTDPVHSGPIEVGGELWFFYRGSRLRSRDGAPPGEWPQYRMAIGLARLRRDGFVSLDAGQDEGKILTRPLTSRGGSLHINAEVSEGGEILVTALDQERKVSVPIISGGLDIPVRWQGAEPTEALTDRPVRLAFTLRDAKLYSFRIA